MGTCEFDGKLSVVYRQNTWFLFGRSNPQEQGGRYVQVTTSRHGPIGPWSEFRHIKIAGYNNGRDGNIYMLCVDINPLDVTGRQLIGLLPMNEGAPGTLSVENTTFNTDGDSYIALTLSCDGVHWTHLVKLVSSDGYDGRTLDHPVDGIAIGEDNESVFFYIQRDVQGISPFKNSSIVQHQFNTKFLRNLTLYAQQSLPGCK